MLIQASGKNRNGELFTFSVFTPGALLEEMRKKDMDECRICFDGWEGGDIHFWTVSQERVQRWAERGVFE